MNRRSVARAAVALPLVGPATADVFTWHTLTAYGTPPAALVAVAVAACVAITAGGADLARLYRRIDKEPRP